MKLNRFIMILVALFGVSFLVYFYLKPKPKIDPPKVEFDFSKMPKDYQVQENTHVNDLEKLFTEQQFVELNSYLMKLENEYNKKVLVLTVPSKKSLEGDWIETISYTNKGVTITFSKSMRTIDLGIENHKTGNLLTKEEAKKIVEDVILPEFKKNNFFDGLKEGILEILKKDTPAGARMSE